MRPWFRRPMRGWILANLLVLGLAGYWGWHEIRHYLGPPPPVGLGAREVGPWRFDLAFAGPSAERSGVDLVLRRIAGPPLAHLRHATVEVDVNGSRAAEFAGSPNDFVASVELPPSDRGWSLRIKVLDRRARLFMATWHLPQGR